MSGEFELNLREFDSNLVWREVNLASNLTALSQLKPNFTRRPGGKSNLPPGLKFTSPRRGYLRLSRRFSRPDRASPRLLRPAR